MRDQHLKVLGLPSTANKNDIKKAYRKLALKYHPDVNKGKKAQAQFIAIAEAHNYLMSNKPVKLKRRAPSSSTPHPNQPEAKTKEQFRAAWAKDNARKKREEEDRELYQFSRSYVVKIARTLSIIYFTLGVLVLIDYFSTYEHTEKVVFERVENDLTATQLNVHVDDKIVKAYFHDTKFYITPHPFTQVTSEISTYSGVVHNMLLINSQGETLYARNEWSVYSVLPALLFALFVPVLQLLVHPNHHYYYGMIYASIFLPLLAISVYMMLYFTWN